MIIFLMPAGGWAEEATTVQTVELTDWKAVFGRVEARNRVPARARLGGTIQSVGVSEGSLVNQGQKIATIFDEKLTLQLGAIDANLRALQAQLENAEAELERGENLLERGVTTVQRLDQLRTQVDVLVGQIDTVEAERSVLKQREAEGAVLAPISGTILKVPVTEGSVVVSGEAIAEVGGGGFYLRLAVPERHAEFLDEGAEIRIGSDGAETLGSIAKVYPLIENGRVVVDVDVEGLATDFVDARVLVRLPVGQTTALMVPSEAVESRMGLDFVTIAGDAEPVQRAVVLGPLRDVNGQAMVEILSGASEGEQLVIGHE
ncbi:efflux RND transporter periplasmic adaptor subunit [Actibacterium pelagium]|nr:efflux RND transporter periplasmic adaptor subunit [Actibacterium pelagium]